MGHNKNNKTLKMNTKALILLSIFLFSTLCNTNIQTNNIDLDKISHETSYSISDLLNENLNKNNLTKNNSCALKCTLSAIGVYWGCAAACIYEDSVTQCITVACYATTAAADVACLKTCKSDE